MYDLHAVFRDVGIIIVFGMLFYRLAALANATRDEIDRRINEIGRQLDRAHDSLMESQHRFRQEWLATMARLGVTPDAVTPAAAEPAPESATAGFVEKLVQIEDMIDLVVYGDSASEPTGIDDSATP